MNHELQKAIDAFDNEVEREAAKLVEQGTSPWIAIGKAGEIVSARRRQKLADEQREAFNPTQRP